MLLQLVPKVPAPRTGAEILQGTVANDILNEVALRGEESDLSVRRPTERPLTSSGRQASQRPEHRGWNPGSLVQEPQNHDCLLSSPGCQSAG